MNRGCFLFAALWVHDSLVNFLEASMSKSEIEVIIEADPTNGPLVQHMRGYSSLEYESRVVDKASDGVRRDIMFEYIEIYSGLEKLLGEENVQHELKSVREQIMNEREHADVVTERLWKESMAQRHHFSGPEFLDLSKILISLGGTAALALPAIKAAKEIIIKLLDNRAKTKLTWKEGTKTIKVEGPNSKKILDELFERLEKNAPAKALPPPVKKKVPQLPAPTPDRAQGTTKKPAKKKPKQKQQS
jgi:hypothetical protein